MAVSRLFDPHKPNNKQASVKTLFDALERYPSDASENQDATSLLVATIAARLEAAKPLIEAVRNQRDKTLAHSELLQPGARISESKVRQIDELLQLARGVVDMVSNKLLGFPFLETRGYLPDRETQFVVAQFEQLMGHLDLAPSPAEPGTASPKSQSN